MTVNVTNKMIKDTIPPMANVESSIRPSYALIFNYYENEDTKNKYVPVKVQKTTILGTLSQYKKDFYKDKNELSDEERQKLEEKIADEDGGNKSNNIQEIDVCYLEPDCDTYSIQGSIKFLCANQGFTQCKANSSNQAFPGHVKQLMEKITEKGGMRQLAEKYTHQLVNGSIAWRNKFAEELRIYVTYKDKKHVFNCFSDMDKYENPEGFDSIAENIACALSDPDPKNIFMPEFEIIGRINKGGEVYPSQEYVANKSKTLYRLNYKGESNVAGIHSQKIGNALRTIDTWYSGYVENKRALPVDPYGPDKAQGKVCRLPKSGESFYEILVGAKQLLEHIEKSDDISNDMLFFAAIMIRGGVFSGKEE